MVSMYFATVIFKLIDVDAEGCAFAVCTKQITAMEIARKLKNFFIL